MHSNAAYVFDKAELAEAVYEEADTGPCGAIISARASCEIFGINISESPGLPNSAIKTRILAKRFSLELKSRSTRSA